MRKKGGENTSNASNDHTNDTTSETTSTVHVPTRSSD